MSNYSDEELKRNLRNEEMWDSVEPEHQVALVSDLIAGVTSNIASVKHRLKHEPTTGEERNELNRKLVSSRAFLSLVQMRSTKARLALKQKNISTSEQRQGIKYGILVRAIEAHRKVTEETDDPNVIGEADEALYAALDEARTVVN